jgi:hypothetical protein
MNSIDEYLKQLRKELAGCDRATIQDALSDAEEHLRTSIESLKENQPDISEGEALVQIIERYGTPGEIADIYKEMESRIRPGLTPDKKSDKQRSWFYRFLGIIIDPRAYGAFFYMIFSLLENINWITSVVRDDGRLIIGVKPDKNAEVSAVLAGENIFVTEMKTREHTLEEYFLAMTGEKTND